MTDTHISSDSLLLHSPRTQFPQSEKSGSILQYTESGSSGPHPPTFSSPEIPWPASYSSFALNHYFKLSTLLIVSSRRCFPAPRLIFNPSTLLRAVSCAELALFSVALNWVPTT